MICPNCGRIINEGSKFCGLCGCSIVEFYGQDESVLVNIAFTSIKQKEWDKATAIIDSILFNNPNSAKAHLGKLLIEYRVSNIEELSEVSKDFSENYSYKAIMLSDDAPLKSEVEECARKAAEAARILNNNKLYQTAIQNMNNAQYENAYRIFAELGNWNNSPELANKCLELQRIAEEKRKEDEIKNAILQKKKRKRNIIISIAVVSIISCLIVFSIINESIIKPNRTYSNALSLYSSGKYAEAADEMYSLKGYKDSSKLAAEYYFKAKDYDSAARVYSEMGNTEKYNESIYLKAVELFNKGNADDATSYFSRLPNDYSDVNKYLRRCAFLPLKNASIGDTFIFGTYEQDNDSSTKNEGIRWVIVEKEGTKVKLFSTDTIDCKRFYSGDGYSYTPWSKTSIRNWLNTSFYNNAFSNEDKEVILTSKIVTDDGHGVDTSMDNVFLISDDEYSDYTWYTNPIPYVRNNSATKYAISQEDLNDDITNGFAGWFTRSQRSWSGAWGGHMHYAPGDVGRDGLYHVWSGAHTGGIKPCIWIDYSLID